MVQVSRERVLTSSETECALLVAEGLGNKQIAFRTGRAEKTVRNHVFAAMKKLRTGSRLELALQFRKFEDDGKRYCPTCGRELDKAV